MDKQELTVNDATPKEEPTPRPWVTPTFERVELKEALSGVINFNPLDGSTTSS